MHPTLAVEELRVIVQRHERAVPNIRMNIMPLREGYDPRMAEYRGGCHCGVLKIIYRTDIDPARWPLRHDGCSFCRRHGVAATSDPSGEIAIEIDDVSRVRRYRFAQRTAEFLLCGECGVFVAALADTASGARGVINARVLDGVALDFNAVTAVHFDDESPAQRTERRSRNWTPVTAGMSP